MRLIRLALATWRLMSLLQSEEGPYSIFERLRLRLGTGHLVLFEGNQWVEEPEVRDIRIDWDVKRPTPGLRGEVARALHCTWCLSVWAAAALALIDDRASPIVDALAASAAVLLADEAWGAVGSQHGSSTDPDMAPPG